MKNILTIAFGALAVSASVSAAQITIDPGSRTTILSNEETTVSCRSEALPECTVVRTGGGVLAYAWEIRASGRVLDSESRSIQQATEQLKSLRLAGLCR